MGQFFLSQCLLRTSLPQRSSAILSISTLFDFLLGNYPKFIKLEFHISIKEFEPELEFEPRIAKSLYWRSNIVLSWLK